MDQKQLAGALTTVVESVVNQVGVEVNTASPALLAHVSGIGPKLAGQIVAHRARHGPFTAVDSLVRVPGIGPATLARIRERLRVLP